MGPPIDQSHAQLCSAYVFQTMFGLIIVQGGFKFADQIPCFYMVKFLHQLIDFMHT